MATKFHVIVLQCDDDGPRPFRSPREVLLHARAEHFRVRQRIALLVAIVQLSMAGFMTLIGFPAAPVLLGILAGGLGVAAITSWAAWVTRKDFLE